MTTHDQHPGVTPTHEEVEPTTVGTDHLSERPAASTASADSPSMAPPESTIPQGEPAAVGADAGRHAVAESSAPNQTPPAVAHSEPPSADNEAPAEMTEAASAPAESQPERSLFADDELAGLRARWDNVQAGFVDDPQQCVQKADGLVSDAVEQLTSGFAEARSRLEEQWARGEQASTEDLRLALKRYRAFFERLLAV